MNQTPKAKLAGIALLGVAAVAGVFGVVSVAGGGSDTTTAADATQTKQHQGQPPQHGKDPGGKQQPNGPGGQNGPGGPNGGSGGPGGGSGGQDGGSGQPGDQGGPGAGGPGAKETKVIQPPSPQEQNQQPADNGGSSDNQVQLAGSDKSAPVRVYNNSTIKGLANQAANKLRGAGFNVTQVDNYPQGKIPATTVYYREGTEEQGTAEAAAKQVGAKAEPRFPGLSKSSPGVIMIVTQDFAG